ncbi:MAG: hypothetical protein KZQ89_16265 [Candidatus Thiodiazotropha sp. (ex Lucinoma kastoroae)]|nr:hypothetical protein [Candidatus Thiodiazotropha sp. (ex Rostrolucina anterorostrata)]MCU7849508.1 hypothetical protein [Candidatus Thiodiazotropha sp. (ex Lucinoma kastoroae)]
MDRRKQYKKRAASSVSAIKLDLETEGFTYRKWGGLQTCKRGDWLVNNEGDVYTVDAETFTNTYTEVSAGLYIKTAEVWAEVADKAGAIQTLEGETQYLPGDYLVYNDKEGLDGYAVSQEKFESMYESC